MRVIYWVIKAVLFVLLLAFAFRNTDPVIVRGFLGHQWQPPLVFMLLIFFCGGFLLGVAASLGMIVRQRRVIVGLKRELRTRQRGVAMAPAAEAA